jgi:hypothetical protein
MLLASAFVLPKAQAGDAPSRWLITARISKAILLEQNEDSLKVAPSTYSVKLTDVEVIQGESQAIPKMLNVKLKANHIEAAKKLPRVFLVVEMINEVPIVRYWEAVIPLACVPKELIAADYADQYFSEEWNAPNQQCTFVDKHQEVRDRAENRKPE